MKVIITLRGIEQLKMTKVGIVLMTKSDQRISYYLRVTGEFPPTGRGRTLLLPREHI